MSKSSEPLGAQFQQLVICGICEAVVDQGSAKKVDVDTPKGLMKVWVCKTCQHLGSQEQARKYIMKENKIIGR